jgi:hypothetical protein
LKLTQAPGQFRLRWAHLRGSDLVDLAPFCPGYNFVAWDRRMRLLAPADPSLSIDHSQWRKQHSWAA